MKLWCSRRNSGFTLIELLTVITIAAILMAIGIPSYRSITNSSRISGEVNGLLGDMQLARAEAIKQGLPVTVCISSNGTGCATSGVNWNNGWIVFLDNNGNQIVTAGTPADTIFKVQAQFTGGDTLVSDNPRAVTFNREGFATLVAGSTTYANALITLHASTATTASTRCLSLNALGRMVIQKAGTGSCS